MRPGISWANAALITAVLLLPIKAGGCTQTACFTFSQAEYDKNGGACPAGQSALKRFSDPCEGGPIGSVQGAGSFDGEFCCYAVGNFGNDEPFVCGAGGGDSGGRAAPARARAARHVQLGLSLVSPRSRARVGRGHHRRRLHRSRRTRVSGDAGRPRSRSGSTSRTTRGRDPGAAAAATRRQSTLTRVGGFGGPISGAPMS